jgi:MoaA/NifB/PqqE/SkfB family radical SAM enzyme
VRLNIVSNGTVLPRQDDDLESILRQTATLLLSVDSLDRDTFARIRGRDRLPLVRTNLDRIVAVRARLPLWSRPRVGINVVWMRDNLDHLPPIIELAAALGLDLVTVAHLTVHAPEQDPQSLRHCPERADRARTQAARLAQRRGVALDLPPAFGPGAPVLARSRPHLAAGSLRRRLRHRLALGRWKRSGGGAGGCPYLESRAYVSIDGLVSPCCMPGRPLLGDLRKTSLAEIWTGPVARRLREALHEGRPEGACAHCSVHRQGDYRPADPATVVPGTRGAAGEDAFAGPHPGG